MKFNIENISTYFQRLWEGKRPLAKLIRANSKGFFYDTGTNKILRCDEFEYKFLKYLLTENLYSAILKIKHEFDENQLHKSFLNIKNAIETENVLKLTKALGFNIDSSLNCLEDSLNSHIKMIVLEVTEKCNLRCDYCVYNDKVTEKRNHGNLDMALPIAYKSIDFLADHSKKLDKISISFYGGEPLLVFPLIKSCVNYALGKFRNQRITFAMTTNATLLTKQIAKFLYDNNFSVVVSLDGPETIHNEHRKDSKGNGSFKNTIKGLKNIIDIYGEDYKKLFINTVYSPPYYKNKIYEILSLWDQFNWLPKNIYTSITYPVRWSPLEEKNDVEEKKKNYVDTSLIDWIEDKFIESYISNKSIHPLAHLIEKNLIYLYKRPIYELPIYKFHLNGCCLPGMRKIFIKANGDFKICERIPISPKIGNIHSGFDLDTIKKIYFNDYSRKSIKSCEHCWGIQLCHMCYVTAFRRGKISIDTKDSYCKPHLYSIERNLTTYCKLLDINPNGLNYLSNKDFY